MRHPPLHAAATRRSSPGHEPLKRRGPPRPVRRGRSGRAPADELSFPTTPQQAGAEGLSVASLVRLQKTVGNDAVLPLLQRDVDHRPAGSGIGTASRAEATQDRALAAFLEAPVLQRWANASSAQPLADALPKMSFANLQKVLKALDSPGPDGTVAVPAPAPLVQSVTIDGADAVPLRTAAVEAAVPAGMTEWAAARTGPDATYRAATGADQRQARVALLAIDTPWIGDLKPLADARPGRWDVPDGAVEKQVLAAFELAAATGAEAGLDDKSTKVHTEVTQEAGMDESTDWCGYFAMHQFLKEGMSQKLQAGFFHVNNLLDFFQYTYDHNAARVAHWVWAEGSWQDLQTFHAARNSSRQWLTAAQIRAGGTLDVQPGDIVLLDVAGGADPDHICMVENYDATTGLLDTIGGNDSGYVVDSSPAIPSTSSKPSTPAAPAAPSNQEVATPSNQEVATGRRLKKGSGVGHVGVNEFDLQNQPATNRTEARVFGIGRVSLVDLEAHSYAMTPKAPTTPPSGPQSARP